MTHPSDPRVTRAIEAFYSSRGSMNTATLQVMALNGGVREAMARALDAADEPLPVRDVSRGTRGQRVFIDEVNAWPVAQAAPAITKISPLTRYTVSPELRRAVDKAISDLGDKIAADLAGKNLVPPPTDNAWLMVSEPKASLFRTAWLRGWRRRAR